ncbi:MAG: hypothetical protein J4G12_05780 [Gemmatimonadetes bacterium]|nr:hypothetical protein [Gemmatimonadota bacterium]
MLAVIALLPLIGAPADAFSAAVQDHRVTARFTDPPLAVDEAIPPVSDATLGLLPGGIAPARGTAVAVVDVAPAVCADVRDIDARDDVEVSDTESAGAAPHAFKATTTGSAALASSLGVCEEEKSLANVDFWMWFDLAAMSGEGMDYEHTCYLQDQHLVTVVSVGITIGPFTIGPSLSFQVLVCDYGYCGWIAYPVVQVT